MKKSMGWALCACMLVMLLLGFAVAGNAEEQPMVKAYLEITMKIDTDNRPAAVEVFTKYKEPFLSTIDGALTKDLLVRDEDVQVLHGFESAEAAQAYLGSQLFNDDVYVGLKDFWSADPDVRIYSVF